MLFRSRQAKMFNPEVVSAAVTSAVNQVLRGQQQQQQQGGQQHQNKNRRSQQNGNKKNTNKGKTNKQTSKAPTINPGGLTGIPWNVEFKDAGAASRKSNVVTMAIGIAPGIPDTFFGQIRFSAPVNTDGKVFSTTVNFGRLGYEDPSKAVALLKVQGGLVARITAERKAGGTLAMQSALGEFGAQKIKLKELGVTALAVDAPVMFELIIVLAGNLGKDPRAALLAGGLMGGHSLTVVKM